MSPQAPTEYQPTWDSLAQHPIPDWLLDAKFGISRLGDWLSINGEAIYGTRPWSVHAEGRPAKFVAPPNARGHKQWIYHGGDAADVRYTQKDHAVMHQSWVGRRATRSPYLSWESLHRRQSKSRTSPCLDTPAH
jgi:hypothetical protein